jgi:hypothetical protein
VATEPVKTPGYYAAEAGGISGFSLTLGSDRMQPLNLMNPGLLTVTCKGERLHPVATARGSLLAAQYCRQVSRKNRARYHLIQPRTHGIPVKFSLNV